MRVEVPHSTVHLARNRHCHSSRIVRGKANAARQKTKEDETRQNKMRGIAKISAAKKKTHAKLANSLPMVVGVAACPCVKDSMGVPAWV
jgi:hypothetical protein